jgi:prepilin-type N-terminal cleavage/methylation domain-containing protein
MGEHGTVQAAGKARLGCDFSPGIVNFAVRRRQGFTLIEIAISVFILLLLLLLALPSVSGVMANRRLQRSLDAMNDMVRQAEERSVKERRPYVLEWQKSSIVLHPAQPQEGDEKAPVTTLALGKGSAYVLRLPAALEKGRFAEWTFWPSGTCEPANIQFKGPNGSWEVEYEPLSARPKVIRYVAR